MSTLPQPMSNSNTTGKLTVTILSAYDLDTSTAPQSITLTVGDEVVGSTSAPSARHKEKKAFKYNQKLVYSAPLGVFYSSNALLTVQSSPDSVLGGGEDQTAQQLEAEFPINSLHVNEPQWIILNLRKKGDDSTTAGTDTVEDGTVPTLRIKANLEGSYRPEVAAMLHSSKAWFNLVDGLHSNLPSIEMNIKEIPQKYPVVKFFLIPAVPLAAIVVALLPVIAGILIVGLPFFLPFLVVLAGFVASILGIGAILYYSTPEGRGKVLNLVHPVASHLISTPVGQRLVYDTGARPSPKSMAQLVLPGSDDMVAKLLASLAIDFVGSCSYLLPGVGEAFDLAWAPTQTIMISAMYDESTPSLKYVSFIEEILPFTDVVPSATIGWSKEYAPVLLSIGQQKVHEIIVAARREKDVAFAK
eukprot:CAMPEP_0116018290 /NCGR_PEP_ID=MMETSP0321-20121206/8557_1 /TAXON_ID=163516 /ORGANISM="Leptocylindrus danicus var. danicus, Strain B650" /LENGTH=414 /DNA_ID=CAMNT_0003488649 /DNA_START=120 /DNA_END=1364 /DNA_ORIENTATION=-